MFSILEITVLFNNCIFRSNSDNFNVNFLKHYWRFRFRSIFDKFKSQCKSKSVAPNLLRLSRHLATLFSLLLFLTKLGRILSWQMWRLKTSATFFARWGTVLSYVFFQRFSIFFRSFLRIDFQEHSKIINLMKIFYWYFSYQKISD